jgi:hypothetical protein
MITAKKEKGGVTKKQEIGRNEKLKKTCTGKNQKWEFE